MHQKDLSIYIHYPFCKSKCPYCDFNSHVEKKVDEDAFEKAYLKEIDFFAKKVGKRRVKTIFFGGGTPSLMKISLVEAILKKIGEVFAVDENCEITLETNPTSYESEKFLDLKKAGINRISIGIQALNDKDLQFLGRTHSSKEAIGVIENANKIFDNISFDLIYARPEQKLEDWIKELEFALSLKTKHLSLYQLTIEKGTQFFSDFSKKKFIMPSEELSAQFYEKTNEIMEKFGFVNYEISNYALPSFKCKHNLAYWKSDDYIGIGAGAHSRVYFEGDKNRKSIMMTHKPQKWLELALENENGIQKIEDVGKNELAEEVVMMGLRLKNGIDENIFKKHFTQNIDEIIDFEGLNHFKKLNFLDFDHDSIKITEKGKILTNAVVRKVCNNIKLVD